MGSLEIISLRFKCETNAIGTLMKEVTICKGSLRSSLLQFARTACKWTRGFQLQELDEEIVFKEVRSSSSS